MIYYPKGTLLCSHRCEQIKSELGTISSLMESVWGIPSSLRFSNSPPSCLPLFTPPKHSVNPTKGVTGVVGELSETTVGSEVKESGANIVKVRSSDVKLETWRVKTWHERPFNSLYLPSNTRKPNSELLCKVPNLIYLIVMHIYRPEQEVGSFFH